MKPKVWVAYKVYDPKYSTLKMWVGRCYMCNWHTQYHSWGAALGSALEHRYLGCELEKLRATHRMAKYSKLRAVRSEKARLSCGGNTHNLMGGIR